MLNLEDYIEDKAYEIVIDNLTSVLIEYADEITEHVLQPFQDRNWDALYKINGDRNLHALMLTITEWYARDNYHELLEQYQSEVENDN